MSIALIIAEKSALQAKRDGLEAKMADLEKALAQPNLDKAEEHDIRKNYDSVTNAMSEVTKEITSLGARLPKAGSGWSYEAIGVMFTGVGMASTSWWMIYPRYCVWRHDKYPYSSSQIKFRQTYFDPTFPEPVKASAHRLSRRLFQGFLTMSVVENIVMWSRNRKAPPPQTT